MTLGRRLTASRRFVLTRSPARLGDQRGRNDIAAVAEIDDLAIKTVTSRTGAS
jgi:hypothetical protein